MALKTTPYRKVLHLGVFTSRAFFVFTLFWCWEAVLVYVPSIHNDGIGVSLLWNTTNYGSLAICILIALGHRYVRNLLGTKRLRVIIIVLLELGTIVTIAVSFFTGSQLEAWQYTVCVAGGIIVSAGIILMDVVLVYLLMEYSSGTNRGALVIGSMAAHLLIYLLIDNLPPIAIMVCVLALPLIVGLLLKASRKAKAPAPAETSIAHDYEPNSRPATISDRLHIPFRYLVVFFSLGLSINFIRNAFLAQADSAAPFANSAVISLTLLFFLIAAAVETFIVARNMSTVIPLAITVYVSVAIFFNLLFPGQQVVMLALTFAGFFLYVTVFYRTIADYAIKDKASMVIIAIAVFTANSFGLSVGSVLWSTINSISGSLTPIISLALAYLIFIAGVFLFFSNRVQTALQHFTSPRNAAEKATSKPDAALLAEAENIPLVQAPSLAEVLRIDSDLLAEGKGLTSRERETLYLMARRKNYLQIAEEMSVSSNTAKSHIRHVYQKLAIHSAEELFQKLEETDEKRLKL